MCYLALVPQVRMLYFRGSRDDHGSGQAHQSFMSNPPLRRRARAVSLPARLPSQKLHLARQTPTSTVQVITSDNAARDLSRTIEVCWCLFGPRVRILIVCYMHILSQRLFPGARLIRDPSHNWDLPFSALFPPTAAGGEVYHSVSIERAISSEE